MKKLKNLEKQVLLDFANVYKTPSESSKTFGVFCANPLIFFFFPTPAGCFVELAENDKLCFFFFFSSRCRSPPRTTPKNPDVPHHFVKYSLGLNKKYTRMPRAIPPSEIDKIASRLASITIFFLFESWPPTLLFFFSFFLFPLAPLSHHLYQLSHHLYRQHLTTGVWIFFL